MPKSSSVFFVRFSYCFVCLTGKAVYPVEAVGGINVAVSLSLSFSCLPGPCKVLTIALVLYVDCHLR